MSVQHYRIEFKELLEKTFLPEDISNEERNEKLLPLSKHIYEHTPSRLFRYRDCSEMNFDAFNEDKLFAVTSDKFNDPYDCLFRYDKEGLLRSIIMGMSKDVVFALRDHFRSGGLFPDLLYTVYPKELLENAKDSIMNASDEMIEEYARQTEKIKEKIGGIIDKITNEAVESVKQMAFIACFSEDIHSVRIFIL